MANSSVQPTNYDKPWPLTYPAPKKMDLNAQFPQGQGVNKSPWPNSNELSNKVKGTKSKMEAQAPSLHPTLGVSQKSGHVISKVASNSIKESSTSNIY